MEKQNAWSDIKLIIIGNSKSGKTSICSKYSRNIFPEQYKSTVVSTFNLKLFKHEGKYHRVQLWELASQGKTDSIMKIFSKNAHGFICVSDATEPTLKDVLRWKKNVDDLAKFIDDSKLPGVLIENKIDLLPPRKQKNDLPLKEFAKENGFIGAFRASAKVGTNVNEAINYLIVEIIHRIEKQNIKLEKSLQIEEEPIFVSLPQKNKKDKRRRSIKKETINLELYLSNNITDNSFDNKSCFDSSSISGDLDFLNQTTSDIAILEEDIKIESPSDDSNEEIIIEEKPKIPLEIKHNDNIFLPKQIKFKVAVIGNSNSGKSSYIERLTKGTFSDEYHKATLLQSFDSKEFHKDGQSYKIQLHDTVSTTNNPLITKLFLEKTNGVIIMCDATKEDNSVQWKRMCCEENTPCIVVYNKIDLLKEKRDNIYKVSVKKNINVKESFESLINEIITKQKKQ